MTTPTLRTPSLRDRKRAQTRARIEDAAVELVLRDGLEHTTVHAISELAEVSPRTFFNYFDSKDGAILGIRNAAMVEERVAEFLAHPLYPQPVDAVVALLLSIFDFPSTRLKIREERMELVRRYPELMTSQFEQLTATHGQLAGIVADILTRTSNAKAAHTPELTGLATITLAMCGTAIRVAMSELAEQHTHADSERIQARAVELIRSTMERIS
ncbi:MAG: TetR/AcrR family transcriptional regulator [Actinomycetota bacterium]|nr:TetR/AcrR family transcriptional regulator [Actinomycetota bacterium]